MGATSVVLRHFSRTEWGTHSTENSRVGTPTRGSSSCAAATASTHTHRASPRGRTGRLPARPGARAGCTGALARPAPLGRRADTRTSVATQARTGRRATWTAHGDYLLVLSSTRTSCQPRHRGARVAPATATRRTIGHTVSNAHEENRTCGRWCVFLRFPAPPGSSGVFS